MNLILYIMLRSQLKPPCAVRLNGRSWFLEVLEWALASFNSRFLWEGGTRRVMQQLIHGKFVWDRRTCSFDVR